MKLSKQIDKGIGNIIDKYNLIRDIENEEQIQQKQKLRRQIEDYLRKYASLEQLQQIAHILSIKEK